MAKLSEAWYFFLKGELVRLWKVAVRFTNEVYWKTSRMWVALKELSRLEPLTRLAEHASRLWVTLDIWADWNHWREWLNTHPGSECSPVFERMRTTDKNGWTSIQRVSALQCLIRSEPLIRMGEHPSSLWVSLQCLSRSEPLMRTHQHPSSSWVNLQCLSRSEPLTRMGGTPIQRVSQSPVFE